MCVITLAPFVVISDHALSILDVCESILVEMLGWCERIREQPYDVLGKAATRVCNSLVEYGRRLHDGDFANTTGPRQFSSLVDLSPLAQEKPCNYF